MRITRPARRSAAVATLGRGERVLQVEGAADGPALHKARQEMRRGLREYLRSHEEVTSIQVMAAACYGGFTVEQYDRSDLLS